MADMCKAIASGYFLGCLDTIYASLTDAFEMIAEYAESEGQSEIAEKIRNMNESAYNVIALPCIEALLTIEMPEFADEFTKSVKDGTIRSKSLAHMSGIRKFNGTEYYASFIENLCNAIGKLGESVTDDILRMSDADYLALTNAVDLAVHDAQHSLHDLDEIVAELSKAVLRKSAENEDIRDIIAYRRTGKSLSQHVSKVWQ